MKRVELQTTKISNRHNQPAFCFELSSLLNTKEVLGG